MRRLQCLDGLRGILAVYVMAGHLLPFLVLPAAFAPLRAAASHGLAAVDLFFALSGLVIVQSLGGFGDRAGPFLLARAARLFPTYLVVLLAAGLVLALGDPLSAMPWLSGPGAGHGARAIWQPGWPLPWRAHLLAHLTMTHGLLPHAVLPYAYVSILGPAWSLSTEWQFYLLIPLLVAAIGGSRQHPFRLAAAFLALAALGLAAQHVLPAPWRFSRAFLPNAAPYFALGIASTPLFRQPRWADFAGYALVLAAVLVFALARGGGGKLLPPLAWTLCLAVQAAPGHVLLRPFARLLRAGPVLWLGAVSYPLYLVNEPVQRLLALVIAPLCGGNGAVFSLAWAPAAVVLPLAAAWLLHRHVERPSHRWGRAVAARHALAASF
ncbi:MAG TPA: acyltransferase [Acetobacteraceae bacterium]|nr:acyltransferase [Acetobacteraceae bacterium]